MTILEVANLIDSFGIPFRLDHVEGEPETPYCVYYFPNNTDFFADNKNYIDKRPLHIEVIFNSRNLEKEEEIETILKSNNLSYYKSVDWLNDEKVYQITYESEVIING